MAPRFLCGVIVFLLFHLHTDARTPYNKIVATCQCELPAAIVQDVEVLMLEGIAGIAKAIGSTRRVVLVGDSTVRGLFLAIIRAASLRPALAAPFSVLERNCPRCTPRHCPQCVDRPVHGSLENFLENFEWGHMLATVAGLRIEYQYDVSSTICFEQRQLRQVLRLHQRDAYAILFNYGLWFLHLFPNHDCLKFPPPKCALYNETVRQSALWLRRATGPSTKLVWKTTNAICAEKFNAAWLQTMKKWHGGPAEREAMEAQCREHCPFYDAARPCHREIFDSASAEWQRNVSLHALDSVREQIAGDGPATFSVQDGWFMTRNRCEWTASGDGRHYATFERIFALDFVMRISESPEFKEQAKAVIERALPREFARPRGGAGGGLKSR
jgi:hypothetical protein